MKYCALALALLAVGGCAYRDVLVLENGEKVDSLYYHESRMPDEVMVERFAVGAAPKKFEGIQSVIQFAMSHKSLCLLLGDVSIGGGCENAV